VTSGAVPLSAPARPELIRCSLQDLGVGESASAWRGDLESPRLLQRLQYLPLVVRCRVGGGYQDELLHLVHRHGAPGEPSHQSRAKGSNVNRITSKEDLLTG
jgi:hypothetical protein